MNSTQRIANVYMQKLMIPTYQLQSDDINPMFGKRLNPYPYTLQNFRERKITESIYDVVVVENEYLKLMVIPSLGGRLFSSFDKRTKKEMFFRNSVIKPGMVGTRGAWFAGGVEFNFPISHSPTTMTRVNYQTNKYEDGSASVVFGQIEYMSNMNWKVEIKLYPGKSYIEQNVYLYNPTAYENRFYFWTNAAVEYNDNVKLIYPFDWCINQYDDKYIKWPFYKGADFSNLREIPYPYETFGKLCTDNFFGSYDLLKDAGVVHYSDTKKLKGAKFFTWGNDDLGEVWNKALTKNEKYFEIQSGLYESQNMYKFLKPHQGLSWSEYWYPVSGTKGFLHAEKEIAVNIETTSKKVDVYLSANEDLGECEIVLNVGKEEYRFIRYLSPTKIEHVVLNKSDQFNQDRSIRLNIYSKDRHIAELRRLYHDNEQSLDTDIYEDARVVKDDIFKANDFKWGMQQESLGETEKALELYRKYLEKNQGCIITLLRLGRLYLKQQVHDEASACFLKVLEKDNRNSEARFLLAVTEKECGHYTKAIMLFTDIPAESEYYKASVIELVKLMICVGKYRDAIKLLELNRDCKTTYLNFLASVAYRNNRLKNESLNIVKRNCIDEFLLTEHLLLENNSTIVQQQMRDYVTDEPQLMTIIILEYISMNLYEDAEKILEFYKEKNMKLRILYYHVKKKLHQEEIKPDIFAEGVEDYAFVCEKGIAKIIEEEIGDDNSGVSDYLLGNYYCWLGRKDKAIELFISSYIKGCTYTVLLRNLGALLYNYKKDNITALKYLEADLKLNDGKNPDILIMLDAIYSDMGLYRKREKLIPYMEKVENKQIVLLHLVNIYSDLGNSERAFSILNSEDIENWEGFENSGLFYKKVLFKLIDKAIEEQNIKKATEYADMLEVYPENLHYGDSIRFPKADICYYKGYVYSLSENEDKAIYQFRKGALEFDDDRLDHNEVTREFSLKCMAEYKKRCR